MTLNICLGSWWMLIRLLTRLWETVVDVISFPLWAVRCDPLKTFTLYTLLMCSLKRKTKRLDLVLLETSSKLLIRRVRTQSGSRLNLGRVHSLDHIDTTFQISYLFHSYWRICIPLTIDPSRSILFMNWFPILLAPTSHLSNMYMSGYMDCYNLSSQDLYLRGLNRVESL